MNTYRDRIDRLKSHTGPFAGTVFRSAAPQYATTTDLLTGEGNRRAGGRWNPVGIATIYGSRSPAAAMAETLAHIRYYGLPAHSAMPRTFVALEVVLSEVLDLTVGENRRLLGVSKKKMTDADWRAEMCNGIVPITNQIAQAAFDTGLEGLLVPSAATSGATNLVCFVKNLLPSSRLAVLSPEEL